MNIEKASTEQLHRWVANTGDEALIDRIYDEIDRRDVAVIEEWYAPAS